MRFGSRIGLSLALLVAPVAVFAQDSASPMASGLWSYAVTMAGIDAGRMDVCLDGDLKTTLAALGQGPRPTGSKAVCEKPMITPIPGGQRIDTACAGPQHSTHMVMTLQELSPTHVKTDMEPTVDGKPGLKIAMDAQRTGECPAGMKPGERKMHLNLLKAPALLAAQKANSQRNAAGGQ